MPPPLLAQPVVPQPLGTPPPPYRAQVEGPQLEAGLQLVPLLVADPLVPALQQEELAEQVINFLYLKLVAFYPYSVLHFSLPYVV